MLIKAVEQQRCGGHHAAEADVGDVAHAIERDQAQAMRTGGPGALRLAHDHAAADATRVEAQLLQQGQKQIVEFVAVTAAPILQDLLLDRRQVDAHRLARQRGEVFKRKSTGVAQLKQAQGFKGRRRGSIEAQTLQV